MPVIALVSGRVWQGMPAGDRDLIARAVRSALDAQINELAGNEPKLIEQFKATGIPFRAANRADAEAVVAEYDKIWLPKAPILAELRKAGQSL
jgi:TRAP-type C4-dicarboxylate transport system substrate-binding protein